MILAIGLEDMPSTCLPTRIEKQQVTMQPESTFTPTYRLVNGYPAIVLSTDLKSKQREQVKAKLLKTDIHHQFETIVSRHLINASNNLSLRGMKLTIGIGKGLDINMINKMDCFVREVSGTTRFEYDGVKGIITIGLPRSEHDRLATSTEECIRDQLWDGGKFYFSKWGETKNGIKPRGAEGIDIIDNNGKLTRKGPDGQLWIDALSSKAPIFVVEVALSQRYDEWPRKDEDMDKAIENRKRKATATIETLEITRLSISKRTKLEGDNIPAVALQNLELDEETEVEDLAEFKPNNPIDPTPQTHKYKRVEISILKSIEHNHHRMTEIVINNMEIWPQAPAQRWTFKWDDILDRIPDTHKQNIMEVSFEQLNDYLFQEFSRHRNPSNPVDLPFRIVEDS
ncbi:hypothetical protein BDD12DRAFT_871734 [Trichophaea hybrida]|nr:hypothetical protein BDD12DRAFT_871734 [Trichophaea hybrida]